MQTHTHKINWMENQTQKEWGVIVLIGLTEDMMTAADTQLKSV